jgi:hypothetical protein
MCEIFGFGAVEVSSLFAADDTFWVIAVFDDDSKGQILEAPAVPCGERGACSGLFGWRDGTDKERVCDILFGEVVFPESPFVTTTLTEPFAFGW